MGSRTAEVITLVVGGTGKTGRRVVQRLEAQGVRTRVGSRGGQPPFDWNDSATWSAALDGVRSAYVTYAPDLAVPAAPPSIEAFARLAVERGVERLVLLSGRGEEEAQRCERIIQRANPAWTVVRASWFNQNFSEAFLCDAIRHGTLALPADAVAEPFIDAEDIADVAVAALTEPGHEGRIYEVTGPRLLTFADAVAEIAAATGRDLRYVTVSADEFAREMRRHETPEEVIDLTRYLFETVLDGRNAHPTDGVQEALGRPPRDFTSYARAAATTGVWADASTVDTAAIGGA